MRMLLGSLVALGHIVLIAAPSWADDRDKAREVIESAIRAHGGAEALAKTRFMQRAAKGNMFLQGKASPLSSDNALQLPDRYRLSVIVDVGDQKIVHTLVVNANRGWQSTGGAAMELSEERIKELQEEMHVLRAMTLLPLKEPGVELSTLPGAVVLGLPALGVQVSSKGHGDLKLYFDMRTSLLVKIERRFKEGALTVTREYLVADHKDFDGVKMPTKYVEKINGNRMVELTIGSYKFPGKFDENTFSKP